MLIEKPTGTIRTAYDLNNDPYLFEATGTEAKHFVYILNAEDEGLLIVLPCKVGDLIRNKADGKIYKIFDIGISHWGLTFTAKDIKDQGCYYGFDKTDLESGKVEVLTGEEAEKALEEMLSRK